MKCIKQFIFCLLVIQVIGIKAQVVWDPDKHDFAMQVKQIDEFIERFNGESNTLLNQYLMKNFPDEPLDRDALIKTLFNQADRSWDLDMIKSFLKEVSDKKRPVLLNYYDDNWYVKLKCQVLYKNQPETVFLTLTVEKEADYAARWVIRGVEADFLCIKDPKEEACLPDEMDKNLLLNPASHGTDFINIGQVFDRSANINSYLFRNYQTDVLTLFVNEMVSKNIKLDFVESLQYHFIQVPGWAFTVSKFKRKQNSGWLIDNLWRMSASAKDQYKKEELNIY